MANEDQIQEQLSELKVMKSAAGYYVGREEYVPDMNAWLPYDRVTNYLDSRDKAENLLPKAIEVHEKQMDRSPEKEQKPTPSPELGR